MATQITNPQRAGIHQREDRLKCTPTEEAPATSDEAASKNVTTSKPDAYQSDQEANTFHRAATRCANR